MPDETMRAEFEAWDRQHFDLQLWLYDRRPDGKYYDMGINSRWATWQASRTSAAPALAPVVNQSLTTAAPGGEPVAHAAREVGKWLNERPNRPIDLEAVAQLVHFAQAPSDAGQRALTDVRVYLPSVDLAIDALDRDPPTGMEWPVNWPIVVYGLKQLRAAISESEGGSNG